MVLQESERHSYMITAAFLKIIYFIFLVIGSPFLLAHDVTLSTSFTSSISNVGQVASSLNAILPVYELIVTICVLFLAYETAYLVLKLFNFVIRKIPGVS